MHTMKNLVQAALALGLQPDDTFRDNSLSVGAEVVRPFGGKLAQRAGSSRGLMVGADVGGSSVQPNDPLLGILRGLGGSACKVTGEPMPGGDCARRLCLTQLFYGATVAISATAQAYSLNPRDWFLPIAWVDWSAAAVSITSITYKSNPVFESTGTIIPSSAFPPTSNWNMVIGIPAISNVTGYSLVLANSTAGAVAFAGKLVGVGMRSS